MPCRSLLISCHKRLVQMASWLPCFPLSYFDFFPLFPFTNKYSRTNPKTISNILPFLFMSASHVNVCYCLFCLRSHSRSNVFFFSNHFYWFSGEEWLFDDEWAFGEAKVTIANISLLHWTVLSVIHYFGSCDDKAGILRFTTISRKNITFLFVVIDFGEIMEWQ